MSFFERFCRRFPERNRLPSERLVVVASSLECQMAKIATLPNLSCDIFPRNANTRILVGR